jgi:hypothetical protein
MGGEGRGRGYVMFVYSVAMFVGLIGVVMVRVIGWVLRYVLFS